MSLLQAGCIDSAAMVHAAPWSEVDGKDAAFEVATTAKGGKVSFLALAAVCIIHAEPLTDAMSLCRYTSLLVQMWRQQIDGLNK